MYGAIPVDNLRRTLSLTMMAGILAIGYCPTAAAQGGLPSQAPYAATLFENVRIFDGKNAALSASSHVLVRGNAIERISPAPIDVSGAADVQVIAAEGRVLMPGLIDAHWHAYMAATPQSFLMTAEPSYLTLLAARQAEATLMRGFTTIRDLGGPVFGLKRAIDEGVIIGPRIYPSGAFISQTSGHGDFRGSRAER
jgi:imidazolonepropionase-like amidohydrolase